MSYQITLLPKAQEQLAALPKGTRRIIDRHILALAENPRPHGVKILKGNKEYLRLRVGDYRIVYTVEDRRLLVIVIRIGHRKDVYRGI